jgi:hypothetical protein
VRHVRPTPDMRLDAPEIMAKIFENVKVMPSGCWEWQKWRNALGYGTTSWRNRPWMVTRLIYTASHGAFDPMLYVCHKCDNPPCCNPGHLFLGDHTTNQLDMIAKKRHTKQKRTHCARYGHPLSGDNIWLRDGRRVCRMCQTIRGRLKAGWSLEEAKNTPLVPPGARTARRDFFEGRSRDGFSAGASHES